MRVKSFLSGISSFKLILIYIVASGILLYFIFNPAINILYYALDDYRYAFGGWHKICKLDDGFEFMITLGRPLQAYLDCLSFKFAYSLERMRDVRIVSIILMACGMGLFIDWLITLGLSLGVAFFAAGCFFLVPEMYFDAIFTGSQPLPCAILLVLLAYRYLNKTPINKRTTTISAALLFCSILIYPAMSFLFGTLMLTKLLFSKLSDWDQTRQALLRELAIFITVCTLYFVWAYINMRFFPLAPVTDVAYQLNHPNLNFIEIFKRFLTLANVFNNLWMLSPLNNMTLQAISMIILFFSGIILAIYFFLKSEFYLKNKHKALRKLIEAIFATFTLLLVSSTFFLIMPSEVIQPRLLIGTISAGLVLLLWCVSYFKKTGMFIFVALFFSIQAYQTNVAVTASALGYNEYLRFTRTTIANYLSQGKDLKRIHFIVAKTAYPYDKFFLANGALMQILGRNTYKIQWCSLSRGTKGEEKDHQAEAIACINKLPKKGIAITYSYPNEFYQKTNNMLLIDMQNLSVPLYTKQNLQTYFNV